MQREEKTMWRYVVALLLSGSLLIGGCAQATEKAVENATGIKVDTNAKGDSVTITNNDGEKITVKGSNELPAELKDFPVPDGFKSDGGGTMSSNGASVSGMNLKGKGTIKDVAEYYKSTLPSKGWTKEGTAMESEDSSLLSFKKGDFSVMLTINKEKSGDGITVGVIGSKSSSTPQVTKTKSSSDEAKPTSTPAKPKATSTPAAPATTDASVLPAELKDIPVPSGFAVAKGSTSRLENKGAFAFAGAKWVGQGNLADIYKFYSDNLPSKGWKVGNSYTKEDIAELTCTRTQGSDSYNLIVEIQKKTTGIEAKVSLNKK
jgi:hypothetical protein